MAYNIWSHKISLWGHVQLCSTSLFGWGCWDNCSTLIIIVFMLNYVFNQWTRQRIHNILIVADYNMMVSALFLLKLPASTEISLLQQEISLWKFLLLNISLYKIFRVKIAESEVFTSCAYKNDFSFCISVLVFVICTWFYLYHEIKKCPKSGNETVVYAVCLILFIHGIFHMIVIIQYITYL